MSPRDGDAFPVRSKRIPARLDVRPRNPRNIHEIHKISTGHKTRKPAQMLAFLKISTKSTISTGFRGCVSHACVPMRAKVRTQGSSGGDLSPTARMAVFSRFGGGKTLRRVSVRLASRRPKKGLFWAFSSGPSNRPVPRTRKGVLRVESRVPT